MTPSLRLLKTSFCGALLALLASCGPEVYSTDVPVEFHDILKQKYEGKQAWTRRTLVDEKKPVKIEQDQEVVVESVQLTRSGSVTLVTPNGRTRVVFPLHLARPLSLEKYEKELLDVLWFETPDQRYAAHKEAYGTRIAEAIRDHKILKDMSQMHAYLSWGSPTNVSSVVKRGLDETWDYQTPNLKDARIVFRSGKVAQSTGENIQDTEAAKRRKSLRRSSS